MCNKMGASQLGPTPRGTLSVKACIWGVTKYSDGYSYSKRDPHCFFKCWVSSSTAWHLLMDHELESLAQCQLLTWGWMECKNRLVRAQELESC